MWLNIQQLFFYSQTCWIGHLFKCATCVKAPAFNIPDQFLYDFVLYKSATFTWAPSASKCIPKTQFVLRMMTTYYLFNKVPRIKILIAHNHRQLNSNVNRSQSCVRKCVKLLVNTLGKPVCCHLSTPSRPTIYCVSHNLVCKAKIFFLSLKYF